MNVYICHSGQNLVIDGFTLIAADTEQEAMDMHTQYNSWPSDKHRERRKPYGTTLVKDLEWHGKKSTVIVASEGR